MKPLNIAIVFGGCSPEYSVSLQSAYAVLAHLNSEKYTAIPIGITKDGDWFRYRGDLARIPEDTWWKDPSQCVPAAVAQSRSAHGMIELLPDGNRATYIDLAFPVLHGQNGEDGTVQGLFELAGIPLVGCGTLASALCMDKDRAHKLAALAGVAVPDALMLEKQDDIAAAQAFAATTGYPLYVKPVRAGSSYGVSRVENAAALPQAISLARKYDDHVLIEQAIPGFEVGCAVMGNEVLTVGEVDEIALCGGFFNYTEKYTLQTASIHVPARIDRETSNRVKEAAKTLYRALGCTGFARVDLFLTPENRIVFNEINTIPGFTEHSRFPAMLRAAGIGFSEILEILIQGAIKK